MFDLTDDCLRFVTGYFEIISASSPHIYHSALVIAPQKSMVRTLYESHTRPFIRVVCGVPMSWDASTAAITRSCDINLAAWSPCDRFIAITRDEARTVDVLDSVTLQRLQTLELSQDISLDHGALIFSPDSRNLTYSTADYGDRQDQRLFVVSWDLQTGGASSVIRQEPARDYARTPSITYSANGEMVGVACYHSYYSFSVKGIDIFVYDVASGVLMHSHSLDDAIPFGKHIWTHGESLRFATANGTTITIWEVRFVPGATPTEVETLPAPVDFDGEDPGNAQLHPAPYRLAFVSHWDRTLVWDVRNSGYLLDHPDVWVYPQMTFSSDGRFFACTTRVSDIYLWKESPTGYMLHGSFTSNTFYPNPLLARNGKSIITFGGRTIQLWHTESFITPPSNIPIQTPQLADDFILDFASDGTLAVVAMRERSTVTVLSLRSGVPQLTIDADMGVYGLGAIGNTVVVIGREKVITWDLPAGDCIPGARVGPEDSSSMINLDHSPNSTSRASISPDSRHIAIIDDWYLWMFSASTGLYFWTRGISGLIPCFSPDGCDVWVVEESGRAEVWNVSSGQKVPGPLLVDIEHPPEGYPWGSPCGYRVTDEWWVLSPDGKRLLMLPPTWQSSPVDRVWKGKFLALLHRELSEPVILEL